MLSKSRQEEVRKITCEGWVTFFSKLARWRLTIVLKMNSFTDVFRGFCIDFNYRHILFWKKADSHLPKIFFCFNESPLKMMWLAFLFHLKSSSRSQGIQIFVLTFWSCRKSGLIRKIRVIIYDVATLVNKQLHIAQYLTR